MVPSLFSPTVLTPSPYGPTNPCGAGLSALPWSFGGIEDGHAPITRFGGIEDGQTQGKLQLLPPAPRTSPFPEEKSMLGVIYRVLLLADMNAATPLGAWGRSVIFSETRNSTVATNTMANDFQINGAVSEGHTPTRLSSNDTNWTALQTAQLRQTMRESAAYDSGTSVGDSTKRSGTMQ